MVDDNVEFKMERWLELCGMNKSGSSMDKFSKLTVSKQKDTAPRYVTLTGIRHVSSNFGDIRECEIRFEEEAITRSILILHDFVTTFFLPKLHKLWSWPL